MEDTKYKDFLEQRHPELLKEAEDFFDVSDRGTWEYICKLMPKLADLPHEKIDPDTLNREFGWYVYREVNVGQRTAKVGVRLWVHAHKIVGQNWTKVRLNDDEHYIEFYTCFDKGSCSCYQTMTNLPGISCGDGNGNKYPVDIPTKRELIYKYLGIEP
jgi:hypothetical protein